MALYKITCAVIWFGELKFKQRPREEQAEADGTSGRSRDPPSMTAPTPKPHDLACTIDVILHLAPNQPPVCQQRYPHLYILHTNSIRFHSCFQNQMPADADTLEYWV